MQSSELFANAKANTVEPLPTDISIIQAPLCWQQFTCTQRKQISHNLYIYNTDTSMKWTFSSGPLVSVLEKFDCIIYLGEAVYPSLSANQME